MAMNPLSLIPVFGGLFGESSDVADRLSAEDLAALEAISAPSYRVQAFNPEEFTATQVSESPELRNRQLALLDMLQGNAERGLSESDAASYELATQRAQQGARQRDEALILGKRHHPAIGRAHLQSSHLAAADFDAAELRTSWQAEAALRTSIALDPVFRGMLGVWRLVARGEPGRPGPGRSGRRIVRGRPFPANQRQAGLHGDRKVDGGVVSINSANGRRLAGYRGWRGERFQSPRGGT